MNDTRPRLIARVWVLGLAAAFLCVPGEPARAQDYPHLAVPQPGGMPGRPVITGVTRLANGVNVTWSGTPGSAGYYQIFQTHSLHPTSWQAVGAATALTQATITPLSSNAFFRVSGPPPAYAGDAACAECHGSALLTDLNGTLHGQAFQTLLQMGQSANPSLLPSYTVGYGLPTGFSSAAATPQLEGVQCENCHGPAANHAADEFNPTVLPQVELAATLCGGCHTGPQQPNYDEWTTSAHSQVPGQSTGTFPFIPDMNAANVINACGQCHSGSARLSLLYAEPAPTGDADMPVTCAVCHDPHAEHTFANVLNGIFNFTNEIPGDGTLITVISNTQLGAVYTQQLLNPLASTNDYFVPDGTTIATAYNPNINLCAQCHNDRGESWTNTSYSPHPSLQYNMLLGTVGVLSNGAPSSLPATHSRLEMQCVSCHMQTAPYQSAALPAITGHSFKVQLYNVCIPCHGSAVDASNLVVFLQEKVTTPTIQALTNDLNLWAITKAPAILGTTNYGTRAWEYTTPGGLSPGGLPGPTAALQTLIPTNICKARFNLYAVYNDGSGGVHNPFYVLNLLAAAQAWVQGELNQPNP